MPKKKKNRKKALPKKLPRRRKRNLSVAEVQDVRTLAEQLGKLIPQSGYRSSFSLVNLAKELKLSKYLPKKAGSKKEAFASFIDGVLCYRPRTLKKVVREILPKGIEKRHREGNPVLEEEALDLTKILKRLGVDMKKEVDALNLPKSRPKIVPPPIEIQKLIESFKLHPVLLPDCQKMFVDGHINESVRKALERFEKHVQDLSGIQDKDGADLMAHVFSETSPIIKLNDVRTKTEINEQAGFKFIAMGMMRWWRNNLSHGDEQQLPHHEACGRLILLSNLFSRLDERLTN